MLCFFSIQTNIPLLLIAQFHQDTETGSETPFISAPFVRLHSCDHWPLPALPGRRGCGRTGNVETYVSPWCIIGMTRTSPVPGTELEFEPDNERWRLAGLDFDSFPEPSLSAVGLKTPLVRVNRGSVLQVE